MSLNIKTSTGLVEIGGKVTKDKIVSALEYVPANETHTEDTDIHITSDERESWNAKADQMDLDSHTSDTENPHNVTAFQVGLGNVDNTSDIDKPVSTAQQSALNALKAELSETIVSESNEWVVADEDGNIIAKIGEDGLETTNVIADTITANGVDVGSVLIAHTNDTTSHITATERTLWNSKVDATYVDEAVANLVNSAPDALNTLDELAAALGDDANFAATVTNSLAEKANQTDLESHTNNNTIHIASTERESWNAKATTNYVDESITNLIGSAPETLNTLGKISTALGNNENFATTVANQIASKVDQTEFDEHTHTKADIGLGNVDNTSDVDKPVSTAQQEALNNLKTEMSETIVSENNEWIIVDENENVIARVNGNGLETTNVIANAVVVGGVDVATALDGKSNNGHTHDQYLEADDISSLATTEYVDTQLATKADSTHNHDGAYDAKGSADEALSSAKSYTDGQISALLDGADDATLDSIKELADAIKTNDSAIDALNEIAAGKANSTHTHTVSNITDLTATATELNYMGGVTSNVQTQFDNIQANYATKEEIANEVTTDKLTTTEITAPYDEEIQDLGTVKVKDCYFEFHDDDGSRGGIYTDYLMSGLEIGSSYGVSLFDMETDNIYFKGYTDPDDYTPYVDINALLTTIRCFGEPYLAIGASTASEENSAIEFKTDKFTIGWEDVSFFSMTKEGENTFYKGLEIGDVNNFSGGNGCGIYIGKNITNVDTTLIEMYSYGMGFTFYNSNDARIMDIGDNTYGRQVTIFDKNGEGNDLVFNCPTYENNPNNLFEIDVWGNGYRFYVDNYNTFEIDRNDITFYGINGEVKVIESITNLQTQVDELESSMIPFDGLLISLPGGGGLKTESNVIFGENDAGQACIVSPERKLAVGTDELDGDYNEYVFPEKSGTVALLDDIPDIPDYITTGAKSGTTIGVCATAEGYYVEASGDYSHAEGFCTTSSGDYSHAEGADTIASGDYSHTEGSNTEASVEYAHAEGCNTTASNMCAHAEGSWTTASGMYAHAEGSYATAEGSCSHAEGNGTNASGTCSHAEGNYTTASGMYSHAEGNDTVASGSYSHASGYGTIANDYQYVVGKYNADTTAPTGVLDTTVSAGLFIVGIGSSDSTRSNGFRIAPSGKVYGTGVFGTSGADYAEYFEWFDGNPNNEDRRGRFVTLEGDKIRYATPNDDYILGVVSSDPSVAGDIYSEDWHNKYLKDVFGSKIVEVVEVEETTNEDGKIIPAHTEQRWVLNPDYNSDVKYTSREERPEWAAIGIVGKLVVVDDGTCQVNGYCYPNANGVATASQEKTNYRVMERLDDTHIKIFIR